jgi:hypothetical protein
MRPYETLLIEILRCPASINDAIVEILRTAFEISITHRHQTSNALVHISFARFGFLFRLSMTAFNCKLPSRLYVVEL